MLENIRSFKRIVAAQNGVLLVASSVISFVASKRNGKNKNNKK